jgi:hypothetical protein
MLFLFPVSGEKSSASRSNIRGRGSGSNPEDCRRISRLALRVGETKGYSSVNHSSNFLLLVMGGAIGLNSARTQSVMISAPENFFGTAQWDEPAKKNQLLGKNASPAR